MTRSTGIQNCPSCGRKYNFKLLANCPSCAKESDKVTSEFERQSTYNHPRSEQVNDVSEVRQSVDTDASVAAIRNLIQATNRTTYAVRALVSYVAILTITAFLAAFVYNFGVGFATGSGNFDILPWTTGLTYVIAITGSIWALTQFLREWRLSSVK